MTTHNNPGVEENPAQEPCVCDEVNVQALMCELLDPGIDARRAQEIRSLILDCPECVARLSNEQEIRLLMKRCCTEESVAPGTLRERITTQIQIISRR